MNLETFIKENIPDDVVWKDKMIGLVIKAYKLGITNWQDEYISLNAQDKMELIHRVLDLQIINNRERLGLDKDE